MNESLNISNSKKSDFFDYWESLGFFDNVQMILPQKFYLLFEIARLIFTTEKDSEARNAVNEISREEIVQDYDRDESILVNRIDKMSPLSDNLNIDNFRTIYDLKKALPRELAWEKQVFDMKLFTRSLLVQRFYEQDADNIKPISTSRDDGGSASNRFEQKFFLLLDRSNSMEMYMRSFYSKCIVAELLRRKFNSNAKIFYRAFDTDVSPLVKIEKKDDFPALVEKVLFTTTGGSSTNMQKAILHAINDINYDKDMMDAEILVITDGVVDNFDKDKLTAHLNDIKLNILKIGRDLAEPNYFDLENVLARKGYNFDPQSVSLNEIKDKMDLLKKEGEEAKLNYDEKNIYRYILECSDEITNNLKEATTKFIEIDDLKTDELYTLNDDVLNFIIDSVSQFSEINIEKEEISERVIIYKRIYFLSQYIEFLMDSKHKDNEILNNSFEQLSLIKQRMLSDSHLLEIVMRTKGLEDNKKSMRIARKEAKKRLKQTQTQDNIISNEEIKRAKMLLTMDMMGGEDMGLILRALFIKLWMFIKRLISLGKKEI